MRPRQQQNKSLRTPELLVTDKHKNCCLLNSDSSVSQSFSISYILPYDKRDTKSKKADRVEPWSLTNGKTKLKLKTAIPFYVEYSFKKMNYTYWVDCPVLTGYSCNSSLVAEVPVLIHSYHYV